MVCDDPPAGFVARSSLNYRFNAREGLGWFVTAEAGFTVTVTGDPIMVSMPVRAWVGL